MGKILAIWKGARVVINDEAILVLHTPHEEQGTVEDEIETYKGISRFIHNNPACYAQVIRGKMLFFGNDRYAKILEDSGITQFDWKPVTVKAAPSYEAA